VPRLLLLRHGQTEWNLLRRFQGQQDIPLDEAGLAQAMAVGPVIAEAKPSVVWSSDSRRAFVTAEAIGFPVVADPRLREIDLGTYEGMTPEEWEAADPAQHALWRAGHDVRRGGGETYQEVGVRAAAAVREAVASAEDPEGLVVVVSHGGTIRAILADLLALPESPWGHLGTLGNCCGGLLHDAGDGRGWRLLAYGVRAEFLLDSPSR
jgi:glucosyl-3-phosphoglycerate phosphatase